MPNTRPKCTVAQIESAFGGPVFNVAIDVNTSTDASETLNAFTVTVNNSLFATYPSPPAPTNIANGNLSGNGFADWSHGEPNGPPGHRHG
jgi:hypothetical protein